MENVIHFFRDTLSGPSYIIYVIVLVILIFACIGYIAENKLKEKKQKDKYAEVAKPGEVVKSLEETAPISVVNNPVEEVNLNQAVTPNSNQQIKVAPVNENVVNSVPLQPVAIPPQQIQPVMEPQVEVQPVGINPVSPVVEAPVQSVNPIPQVVQESTQTVNPVPEQKIN
jgi:Na+-transporting methylmalonyl-CoA/oxaloacetate decarboxylase gamma subunit